ncbi:uncharacterized protein [Argopecten irradians]|uniref:uncharacterized protein n=1 Tax=Argopecten irradians TaxID=31199 RepID=UPI00371A6A0B
MKETLRHLSKEIDELKQDHSSPPSGALTSTSASIISNANTEQKDQTAKLYNGYTKEQLKCKIMGIKEYGRATKLLLRLMFQEQELQGRSATGFGRKPAINNLKKDVLCDIIQELYHCSRANIHRKLADILKPSSCHREK